MIVDLQHFRARQPNTHTHTHTHNQTNGRQTNDTIYRIDRYIRMYTSCLGREFDQVFRWLPSERPPTFYQINSASSSGSVPFEMKLADREMAG